jgi:stage V sporulation protein K
LAELDNMTSNYLLKYYQDQRLFLPDAANRLQKAIDDCGARFGRLLRHGDWRASVFQYDSGKEADLLQALLRLRLLVECIEILTPPLLTIKRLGDEEFDLIDDLHDLTRLLIFSLWNRIMGGSSESLIYGSLALCIAGTSPKSADAAAMLESGYAASNGDPEAFKRWLGKGGGRKAIDEIKGILREIDKHGLDELFSLLTRHALDLGLQPVTIEFARQTLQTVVTALVALDGEISEPERRRSAVLAAQFTEVSRQYAADFAAGHADGKVSEEDLTVILQELDGMVGMDAVKQDVHRATSFARVQMLRREQGLPVVQASLHSVFLGNPGTGKTTVARLMGRIYKSLGLLKRGHVVECDRGRLVAEYVGQTAVRTHAVIDSALDGILFIDEAYNLAGRGQEDFGGEAIETLLKRMEDDRNRLIVIVAGYTELMQQFINSNPGLESRFTNYLKFEDFQPEQLQEIFRRMTLHSGLTCSPEADRKVIELCAQLYARRNEQFGNARAMRNLFELAVRNQSMRVITSGRTDREALTLLQPEDLPIDADIAVAAPPDRETQKSRIAPRPN